MFSLMPPRHIPTLPISPIHAFDANVRFGAEAMIDRTASMGAFATAQDRAECPLPGQDNPPNKDRHGSKVEIQSDPLPRSALGHFHAQRARSVRRPIEAPLTPQ